MSATATRPETSYLLRKLHSLSGIVPVGAFLAEHFWSNSAALVSAEKYNQTSVELQTIPFRVFVEWAFIFFPILFHGGVGVFLFVAGWCHGSNNSLFVDWLCVFPRLSVWLGF